jgi:hypothetical protein
LTDHALPHGEAVAIGMALDAATRWEKPIRRGEPDAGARSVAGVGTAHVHPCSWPK